MQMYTLVRPSWQEESQWHLLFEGLEHEGPVYCSVADAEENNAKFIATGSSDTTVRLWDAERGACIVKLGSMNDEDNNPMNDHTATVASLAFKPKTDGHILVSGGWDKTFKVWDTRTRKCAVNVEARRGDRHGCSYDAFSNLLVTVSSRQHYQVLGHATDKQRRAASWQQELLTSHSTSITACALKHDMLVTSGSDRITVLYHKVGALLPPTLCNPGCTVM